MANQSSNAFVNFYGAQSAVRQYDYKENDQNTYEWVESRQSSDLSGILPVPLPVKARILLLEGLTDGVIAACCSQLGVPKEFFTYHKGESDRVRIVNTCSGQHCLSAKWSRVVNQSATHYEIGSRILKETPYIGNTSRDPQSWRLDHERYQRVPGVFRPYCPISQTPQGIWQHAAREKISLFWTHDNPSLFALVIVDPKREHCITEKRYTLWGTELIGSTAIDSCFLNEVDSYAKVRFVDELKKCEDQALMGDFTQTIQNIIAHIVVTNTTGVLNSLHDALDEIDLSLSQDEILRSSLKVWRGRFGFWRQDLLRSIASVKEISRTFGQHKSPSACVPQLASSSISTPEGMELDGVKADLDDALTRLASTFQAVMSTMSIIESQKAISEAEAVSKLTNLAFFFIPLSYVAAVFGMNVVPFNQKPKLSTWYRVSVIVLILTYGILYLSSISKVVRKTPQSFLNLNSNSSRVSAGAMRWSRILVFRVLPLLAAFAFPFAAGAGLAVGLKIFYTSHLSNEAKIGISFAIFVPIIAFLSLLAFIASRTKRST